MVGLGAEYDELGIRMSDAYHAETAAAVRKNAAAVAFKGLA
jgi:hypothetical protein